MELVRLGFSLLGAANPPHCRFQAGVQHRHMKDQQIIRRLKRRHACNKASKKLLCLSNMSKYSAKLRLNGTRSSDMAFLRYCLATRLTALSTVAQTLSQNLRVSWLQLLSHHPCSVYFKKNNSSNEATRPFLWGRSWGHQSAATPKPAPSVGTHMRPSLKPEPCTQGQKSLGFGFRV